MLAPAPDDHLLRAAHDAEVSPLVEAPLVAGMEPPVGGEARPVHLRVVVVADGHRRPVRQDLADLVRPQVLAPVVHHPNAHLRHRPADGTGDLFRVVGEEGMGLGPALEHPVHLEELPRQPVPHLPDHLDRARGAAGHHHLEAREVVSIEARRVQHRDEMRRSATEVGDPLALDESERILGSEDVLEDEPAADVEGLEDVEEPPVEAGGEEHQEHAVRRDALSAVEEPEGAARGVVDVEDRLRIPRGARGEGDALELVGVGPGAPPGPRATPRARRSRRGTGGDRNNLWVLRPRRRRRARASGAGVAAPRSSRGSRSPGTRAGRRGRTPR